MEWTTLHRRSSKTTRDSTNKIRQTITELTSLTLPTISEAQCSRTGMTTVIPNLVVRVTVRPRQPTTNPVEAWPITAVTVAVETLASVVWTIDRTLAQWIVQEIPGLHHRGHTNVIIPEIAMAVLVEDQTPEHNLQLMHKRAFWECWGSNASETNDLRVCICCICSDDKIFSKQIEILHTNFNRKIFKISRIHLIHHANYSNKSTLLSIELCIM